MFNIKMYPNKEKLNENEKDIKIETEIAIQMQRERYTHWQISRKKIKMNIQNNEDLTQ